MIVLKTYERLKYIRESNDLTQKELADALHMDRSVYNKIESGVRPIRDNELIKFADYFKVSIDYLTDRTSDPTPPKKEEDTIGDSIISHFRINTANMNTEDIEELEEELNEYMNFLIQKAKARKDKK